MFSMELGPVYVEAKSLLALNINGWVDITTIFWFTSYLHRVLKAKKDNRCAFLNVNTIDGQMRREKRAKVEEHIRTMVHYHDDNEFILAPYRADGHWTLFIIAIKVRRVYILDSLFKKGNKNPSHYRLTRIESALRPRKPTFDMVNTWECGYILLQSMLDFVNVYQKQFPKMWNDTKEATDEDIEKTLKELMPILFDGLGIP